MRRAIDFLPIRTDHGAASRNHGSDTLRTQRCSPRYHANPGGAWSLDIHWHDVHAKGLSRCVACVHLPSVSVELSLSLPLCSSLMLTADAWHDGSIWLVMQSTLEDIATETNLCHHGLLHTHLFRRMKGCDLYAGGISKGVRAGEI